MTAYAAQTRLPVGSREDRIAYIDGHARFQTANGETETYLFASYEGMGAICLETTPRCDDLGNFDPDAIPNDARGLTMRELASSLRGRGFRCVGCAFDCDEDAEGDAYAVVPVDAEQAKEDAAAYGLTVFIDEARGLENRFDLIDADEVNRLFNL